MTIDSSADLGTITKLLATHPNVTLGVGPFPVYSSKVPGGVEPGGSALFISDGVPPAQQAAAWAFETYLDSTASQATWAAGTGYIPVRRSSVRTPTIQHLWATNPGFKVAYTQLVTGPDHPGHQRGGHRPLPDSAQGRASRPRRACTPRGSPRPRPSRPPVAGEHSHHHLQSAGRRTLTGPAGLGVPEQQRKGTDGTSPNVAGRPPAGTPAGRARRSSSPPWPPSWAEPPRRRPTPRPAPTRWWPSARPPASRGPAASRPCPGRRWAWRPPPTATATGW